MLGPPKPRRLDEPIAVSLEELVPADNFYRHLEASLNLGFVRDWVQRVGNVSGAEGRAHRVRRRAAVWDVPRHARAGADDTAGAYLSVFTDRALKEG
jgi:hypothetical protein